MTVVREDLSQRTSLSKSVLATFDICNQKAWWSIHDPRPFVPIEKVTFGSALDAAIEVVVKCLASSQPVDIDRALDAAQWIAARDAMEIDIAEIGHAVGRFLADVAPNHDWAGAVTQASITVTLEGLGECNGHPDILLPGEVWDVKATTGKSAKDPASLELGFYVLLREAEGHPVRRVGYMEWRRGAPNGSLKDGKWVTPSVEVTDEHRRWSFEKALQYVRAKKADDVLNRKAYAPINFSMTGGPSWAGLCGDCVFNPANGGPCALAFQRETA